MSALVQNWWVLVVRGALAVLFGVLAYAWPGATIASFVFLFGAYTLVDGVASLAAAFRPAPGESRGWLAVAGILGVLAAIVVFAMPVASAAILFYVVALWAVASGIADVIGAISLRKVVTGEWMLALSGVLSILLGVYMFARPVAGLLGLVWAISLYAIAAGIALILAGFRVRSWSTSDGEEYVGTRATAI